MTNNIAEHNEDFVNSYDNPRIKIQFIKISNNSYIRVFLYDVNYVHIISWLNRNIEKIPFDKIKTHKTAWWLEYTHDYKQVIGVGFKILEHAIMFKLVFSTGQFDLIK